VVLMYHRVAPRDTAGGGIAVPADRFDEHLRALGATFQLLSLSGLVRSLVDGAIPRRSVVVTFDDGYTDNLATAKPSLERHEVSATVFVVSGYVGSRRKFWWDELERICVTPPALPPQLELRAGGEELTLNIAADLERRSLFRQLRTTLGPLAEDEREGVLVGLRTWAGLGPTGSEAGQALSAEGLLELTRGGLVEVGAHTVTHPRLPGLPREMQLAEIRDSVRQLEGILHREVSLFSYPFGAHDGATVACAREAGLACACTTAPGSVRRSTDPYRLPRLYVGDWAADDLVARVSELLR
jgi:peptidoglycan/xylan/chitin deacetylase (PgdA/CDA1 family)